MNKFVINLITYIRVPKSQNVSNDWDLFGERLYLYMYKNIYPIVYYKLIGIGRGLKFYKFCTKNILKYMSNNHYNTFKIYFSGDFVLCLVFLIFF